MNLGNMGLRLASNKQGALAGDAWARLARLGVFLLALALLSMGGPALAQETVDVQLDPVDDSGVSGTARLTSAGEGTEVTLELSGLEPDAEAQASMHAGTCDMPSASFAALPNLRADAEGRATASGRVLFQGAEDVALATMADGEHIISVSSGGQVVACGAIPVAASVQQPSQLPETGGTAFPVVASIVGILGLSALTAGLLLGRRSQA
jgi:LPXTG-motif cell wall-anchored protein